MGEDPKAAPGHTWRNKMCLPLTHANLIANAITRLANSSRPAFIGLAGPSPGIEARPLGAPGEVEGMVCQGPSCMWFVPSTDESGQIVDGSCAQQAHVIVTNRLAAAQMGAAQMMGSLLKPKHQG